MNENKKIAITASGNDVIKNTVRLLGSKHHRDAQRVFIAEGKKLVYEAFDNGCELKQLFISTDCESDYTRLESAADQIYVITPQLMKKITESKTPQDITAVFAYNLSSFDISQIHSGRYIALEHVQDPVNVGALIRSASVFGFDGVILTQDCADIYSQKVLRGSMGAVFRIPIYIVSDMSDTVSFLHDRSITSYAAALNSSALSLSDVVFGENTVLIIGNEGNGLTEKTIESSDFVIKIPMHEGCESLNAAVAGSVLMWEAVRDEH